jgi:hypothetical protein
MGATLIFAASIFGRDLPFVESRPCRFGFCQNSIATRRTAGDGHATKEATTSHDLGSLTLDS